MTDPKPRKPVRKRKPRAPAPRGGASEVISAGLALAKAARTAYSILEPHLKKWKKKRSDKKKGVSK